MVIAVESNVTDDLTEINDNADDNNRELVGIPFIGSS